MCTTWLRRSRQNHVTHVWARHDAAFVRVICVSLKDSYIEAFNIWYIPMERVNEANEESTGVQYWPLGLALVCAKFVFLVSLCECTDRVQSNKCISGGQTERGTSGIGTETYISAMIAPSVSFLFEFSAFCSVFAQSSMMMTKWREWQSVTKWWWVRRIHRVLWFPDFCHV